MIQKSLNNVDEFSKKSKIRLIIFMLLGLVSYLICTISLFFGKGFMVPILSFICLFLLIYFIALDCYKIKFRRILLVLFIIFILETVSFILFSKISWYLVSELVLFNVAILTLLFLLHWQLNHRTGFSPFAYFTEGGFFVISLLTIFFCVLMIGKYTQIPFTCDDIEGFPTKVVETTVNPVKDTRNKIVGRFSKEETINKPELHISGNPLSKSEELASADKIETFFVNLRDSIKTNTLNVKNQVSKTTCEYYIGVLQKTQKSGGIQIAGIIIGYLLLVGIFKILFWIVSVIGFMLFIILRIFGVYKYEKRMVEKEVIV